MKSVSFSLEQENKYFGRIGEVAVIQAAKLIHWAQNDPDRRKGSNRISSSN